MMVFGAGHLGEEHGKSYDVEMKTWKEFKASKIIESVHPNPYEQQYWVNILDRVHQGLVDTWDYQWSYACWSQNGFSSRTRS